VTEAAILALVMMKTVRRRRTQRRCVHAKSIGDSRSSKTLANKRKAQRLDLSKEIAMKFTRSAVRNYHPAFNAVTDDWLTQHINEVSKCKEAHMPRRVALMYSSAMIGHKSPHHPERPERVSISFLELCRTDLIRHCIVMPTRRARAHELKLCHDSLYVAGALVLRRRCTEAQLTIVGEKNASKLQIKLNELGRRQDSVFLNNLSIECALLSTGCVLDALNAVVSGRVDCAAALIRPPGHHAERHRMMGFCVFNNVAVAASRALQMGVNRVMILDWDVHHGNGTQSCFEEDDRVLFVSIHRYDSGGFYPTGLAGGEKKTGFGKGAGFNVNIAWNEGGAGDAEYAAAFELVILPIAVEYAPELIIISSGFDSACGDPLGNCNLTPQGYAWLTHHLRRSASSSSIETTHHICYM